MHLRIKIKARTCPTMLFKHAKEYGGHYDVMMASSGYEGNIDVSAIYNVLIDSSIDIDSYDSKVPYVFGYKLLSKVIGVNDKFDIKKSLILSDIF